MRASIPISGGRHPPGKQKSRREKASSFTHTFSDHLKILMHRYSITYLFVCEYLETNESSCIASNRKAGAKVKSLLKSSEMHLRLVG